MSYSPVLLAHICAGTLGLLSGTAAIAFRKGSPRHMLAGKIFVVSMLIMAVGAVYVAIERNQPHNIGGGILTFYLILTAWLTARRPPGKTSRFDWLAMLVPLALGVLLWIGSIKILRSGATSANGVPVGMTLFLGTVMLLAGRWGRAHAAWRRRGWNSAHRAASVAHVLWTVYRIGVVFPGAEQPSAEIAHESGTRAASVSSLV